MGAPVWPDRRIAVILAQATSALTLRSSGYATAMPKREDIRTILVIGSGPIVIGQGCEFDYSGTQACKALRAEGYRVVLLNSNPATIMTDPELADRTYVEPITPEILDQHPGHGGRARPARGRGAAHDRRPDGPQLRDGGPRARHPRRATAWSSSARRPRPSPRRRTASSSRRPWSASAWTCRRSGAAHTLDEALGSARARGPALRHPRRLHAGRRGQRLLPRRGTEFERIVAARAEALAHQRGADRGGPLRLEGVRARGRSATAWTTS